AWMNSQYPALWDDYCHRHGINLTPCGFTSFYPLGNSDMQAKAQSSGVAGFVAQDSPGAITYVEYSYARNAGFPVAKVLNKANYYVEPTAGSVAVALLKAQIHPDLTQDLSQVYIGTDPRTYPLSSYSYMIIPKDTTSNFDTAKGATLSTFAAYFLCEGQQQADTLGYSPLPVNLVQDGVDQINQIPGSTHKLDRNNLSGCHNPTVAPDGGNLVAENAPQPAPCDLNGPTQCATGTGGARTPTPTSGDAGSRGAGGTTGGAGAGSGGGAGGAAAGGAGGTGGTATGDANGTIAAGTNSGGAATGTIDPDTGQVVGGVTSTTGSGSTGASAVAVTVDVADTRQQMVLATLATVALLGLILGPPLLARSMRGRERPWA
ncbi:MAG: substrate-binding domain-containing protein, partial [Mycobacteriales bacterium]